MTDRPPTPAARLAETVAPYVTEARAGTTKLSISLPTPILEAVRDAAKGQGTSVSGVIAAALRSALEGDGDKTAWPPELVGVARLRGRPVEDLVSEAIDAWLDANGVRPLAEDERRRRFGAFLEARWSIADREGWPEEQVARDVAEAVREVREDRSARRR